MLIAEIYKSLQGEGLLTGTESIFVRASGCNLRCWFCDTPYTSWDPEGTDWSVDEILAEVDRLVVGREWLVVNSHPSNQPSTLVPDPATHHSPLTTHHAVITGGEPMLYSELIPLCRQLRERGLHITIETAGTLYLPVDCDLMSISPKLAGSTPAAKRAGKWSSRHERTRHAPDVIRRLTTEYDYQLKFVIDTPADCDEVEHYLTEFPHVRRDRVLLMPQGTDVAGLAAKAEWLMPYCREQGLVFCPRKQIEWYGAVRGT